MIKKLNKLSMITAICFCNALIANDEIVENGAADIEKLDKVEVI